MYYNLYVAPFNNFPNDGLAWTGYKTLKAAKIAGQVSPYYKKTVRMYNDPFDEGVMAEFKFIIAHHCGLIKYK